MSLRAAVPEKVEPLSLLRCAAQLVERAVRAPRIGDEPFLARKRQDVAMRAEVADIRRRAPAAGLELFNRRRRGRRIGRQCLRVRCGAGELAGASVCGSAAVGANGLLSSIIPATRVQTISEEPAAPASPPAQPASTPCRWRRRGRFGRRDARRSRGWTALRSSRRG